MACGRCGKAVEDPETCWYCTADLCYPCWDVLGHCGHPEAEELNQKERDRDALEKPVQH